MLFQIPPNLIDLLQVLFQANEVLFACQSGHVTSEMEVNYFLAYQHDYHGWTATVMCTNEMRDFTFYQPSLVVCPSTSVCLNIMNSLPLMYRQSNTFLAPASPGLEGLTNTDITLRLDDTLLTFEVESGTIDEHYGIQGENKKIKYGTWNENGSLILGDNRSLWERRSNLMGVKLRASVLNWYPISYQSASLSGQDNGSRKNTWSGFFIDAAIILKNELNLTFSYTSPDDKQWGSKKVKLVSV